MPQPIYGHLGPELGFCNVLSRPLSVTERAFLQWVLNMVLTIAAVWWGVVFLSPSRLHDLPPLQLFPSDSMPKSHVVASVLSSVELDLE